MKKKIMFVLMAGMMAVAACGCGEDNSSGKAADDSKNNTSTIEGEFVGWADSHTVEVKVEDGPMAFQVEDESVKEILEGFKEGTLFTFEIEWDDNGQRITKVLEE